MRNSDSLFKSIFKRKLSADNTRDYLSGITNQYPYFSPAQFFLLLKTTKESANYEQQVAKTAVFFNNPYWLQFQLQELHPDNNELIEDSSESNFKATEAEESIVEKDEVPSEIINTSDLTSLDFEEVAIKDPEGELIENTDQPLQKNESETQDPGFANPVFDENPQPQNETLTASVAPENAGEPFIDAQIAQDGHEDKTQVLSTTENDTHAIADVDLVSHQSARDEEEIITEKIPDDLQHLQNGIHTAHEETADTDHSIHFNNQNTPLINEADADDDAVADKEIEPLNFKLNIEPANTTADSISFEPLHTSDYFASLGIKLSSEIKPGDKLGKQLKSFTEWLKTMKKVHGDQPPAGTSENDASIQKLAEQSNKEDTVVTEAMADVLLMQGKAEKAIEVYKKLSLLNPAKSTYFAAKIDQLKEH